MKTLIALVLAATGMRTEGSLMTPGVRDVSMRVPVVVSGGTAAPTVTIDAMPYTNTTTCTGSYVLTGTSTDASSVAWSSSPSGDSGACTGTDTWSCTVAVSPDATGEGVETITVTAMGAGGDGTDTEDIGFYVAGSHSCFLAQSVDGDYNSTLSDNDAVATWENLGSSALDITQATGTAQPTFKTSIVGGNPVVRFDGGDGIAASTASDWDFLSDGTTATVQGVVYRVSDDGLWQMYVATRSFSGADGYYLASDNRTTSSGLMRSRAAAIGASSANNTESAGVFNGHTTIYENTGGVDLTEYMNGSSIATASGGTSATAAGALVLGNGVDANRPMTGDVFRVLIYQSALTATQRGINKAVDEWALGGTLPVTLPTFHVDASNLGTITSPSTSVTSWVSTGTPSTTGTEATNPPTQSGTGSDAQVDFDGVNDKITFGTTTWSNSTTAWTLVAVVTPDAVDSNGTGANCYLNDAVANDGGPYRGLFFRSDAGVTYAIAYNYDGTSDCAETPITLGAKQVIDASLSGGNVRVGINGGTLVTTASGATTVSPSSVRLGYDGAGGTRFLDGKIHEVIFIPAALSSTDRTTLIGNLMNKWGVTP